MLNVDDIVWVPAYGFEPEYEVSSDLRVRNVVTQKVLPTVLWHKGVYPYVDVPRAGKPCRRSVAALWQASYERTQCSAVEVWRPVVGFAAEYEVSCQGRVRSVRRGMLLAQHPTTKSPYMYVKLTVGQKLVNCSVHKVVAEAFVPNPQGRPQVNHLDGDKLNNVAANLEWVTISENHLHAFALGLKDPAACATMTGTKHPAARSRFHNVVYDASRDKWKASLKVKGKMVFQKRFDSEIEAARAVNAALDAAGDIDRPRNNVG